MASRRPSWYLPGFLVIYVLYLWNRGFTETQFTNPLSFCLILLPSLALFPKASGIIQSQLNQLKSGHENFHKAIGERDLAGPTQQGEEPVSIHQELIEEMLNIHGAKNPCTQWP